MLSPLDIKNKKVEPKKRKYYDKVEMDDYLELVYDNYKELYQENQELKKNMKTLSEGIQYYRSIENTMQKALVLAEKTAKETKDAAQLKAEAIEKDANTKAEKIVSEAEKEYDQIQEKCLHLVQQFNQYKMQLKQVASAQLELITSESFDVYAPEIEAIQDKHTEVPEDIDDEVTADVSDDVVAEEEMAGSNDVKESDLDLGETMIIPDLKDELSPKKDMPDKDDIDILMADTINLNDSLEEIQKKQAERNEASSRETQTKGVKEAVTKDVKDALVLEPTDAVVTEPIDLEPVEPQLTETLEVDEFPKNVDKEGPTLDSLLQSITVSKKSKKKKGQDEDPFEFLGSVDDF